MAFETSDKKLTSLTLNKVTRRQYKAISDAGMVDGDQFYLLTDVGVDAVGLPVRNVGTPVLATDATNLKYVKDWVDNIESSLIGNVVYSGHITINDDTAYEGLEKKTIREIFRGYLAANGVQDVVYTQVPEDAEFDPVETYYVKAGSEYVEVDISAFDPGSIYYTREDGLLDKYELKNGQSFQLTVDMSGYAQTSVASGDFFPETTEYFIKDETGAFDSVPSTAEFDPDERYYIAVEHLPTFVTADGILLSDRDYVIINNHSAIHGEGENVVPVADISRETVDIVDIGSDTLVKKAEYDEFKDETERNTAALETGVNTLGVRLEAAKTELSESIGNAAETAAANLETHKNNNVRHLNDGERDGWNNHVGNAEIHVTAENKAFWSAKTDAMISTTWSDLKTKRDSAKLVPGQEYRITDYVATTNGDMSSQSANHPFDVIVTADAADKLNERARAIRHAADAYFPNATKFEAWQVWYSIDNDANRFAWADTTNGKGVVYRLVDEFGNDVPYDFKGLKFLAYGDSDDVYRYTFDSGDGSGNTDLSLEGWSNKVFSNCNGAYVSSGKQKLNRIVFKGQFCYSNTFGNSCFSNTFGNDCSSNTFGGDCFNNTFGNNCSSNTFGKGCYSNTFGDNCFSNTFGDICSSNTFGDGCSYNTFGNDCSSNAFKNDTATKNYVSYVTVESGNRTLVFDLRGTSSSSEPYRNVTVKAGVNNSRSTKTIRDDTNGGQPFHTTFKPSNSQEISI